MSKKYIITIKSEYEDTTRGIMVLGARDSNLFVDTVTLDDLEELNSDYINEHFGDLQDKAYQQGLDDAWEAAKKIIRMPEGDLLNIFTECYSAVCTALQVLLKYDASEAIEKLKTYEEKQKADDKIEVGDEVKHKSEGVTWTAIVTRIRCGTLTLMGHSGASADNYPIEDFVKTGRHFDIDKILEEMRHD